MTAPSLPQGNGNGSFRRNGAVPRGAADVDLTFTHDLSVTILKDPGNPDADPPDPGDDTFPKAADHYAVTHSLHRVRRQ